MKFEITEVHVVDIPDEELREIGDPITEINDNAPCFIAQYGRDAWCDEVRQLDRIL